MRHILAARIWARVQKTQTATAEDDTKPGDHFVYILEEMAVLSLVADIYGGTLHAYIHGHVHVSIRSLHLH